MEPYLMDSWLKNLRKRLSKISQNHSAAVLAVNLRRLTGGQTPTTAGGGEDDDNNDNALILSFQPVVMSESHLQFTRPARGI